MENVFGKENSNENISGCKIVGVIDNVTEGNKSKLPPPLSAPTVFITSLPRNG
ncbi:MAG: hypothetical protein ACLR56_12205 [Oscillospiraceae bacterium]